MEERDWYEPKLLILILIFAKNKAERREVARLEALRKVWEEATGGLETKPDRKMLSYLSIDLEDES